MDWPKIKTLVKHPRRSNEKDSVFDLRENISIEATELHLVSRT